MNVDRMDVDEDCENLDDKFYRSLENVDGWRKEQKAQHLSLHRGLNTREFYSHHCTNIKTHDRGTSCRTNDNETTMRFRNDISFKTNNENCENSVNRSAGETIERKGHSGEIKYDTSNQGSFNRRNPLQPSNKREGLPLEVQRIMSEAEERLMQQRQEAFLTKIKIKRTAYREALLPINRPIECYGLQQPALDSWNQRMRAHLNFKENVASTFAAPANGSATTSRHLALQLIDSCIQGSNQQLEVEKVVSPIEQYNKPSVSFNFATKTNEVKAREVAKRPSRQSTVPKREMSQDKRNMSNQYKHYFEQEVRHSENRTDFLPSLWCMEPRLFSKEQSSTGKRTYLVSSYGRFVDYYWRKCLPDHRNYYELIREQTPCRLYFDLEFSKPSNPELADVQKTEQLMTELISELCDEINNKFGAFLLNHARQKEYENIANSCSTKKISIGRRNIVDLDSSTFKKFSRHLIVHLPYEALFADAIEVGKFVKNFVGRLAEEQSNGLLAQRGHHTLATHLMVNPSPPKNKDKTELEEGALPRPPDRVCFIDTGVYTRNRLFRLLGSSKFGKPHSASLRIAQANTFPFPDDFKNSMFYKPDRSCQSNSQSDCTASEISAAESSDVDDEECNFERFKSSMNWNHHAEALSQTLVVPLNWSRKEFPILPRLACDETSLSSSTTPRGVTSKSNKYINNNIGPSPFPCLDDFVLSENIGSRGGVQGEIRSWTLLYRDKATGSSDSNSTRAMPYAIEYQIYKNRFCEHVGRHHKSNGIMWIFDLESFYCYQKCWDPDCRAYGFTGGRCINFPEEVKNMVKEEFFEFELMQLDI